MYNGIPFVRMNFVTVLVLPSMLLSFIMRTGTTPCKLVTRTRFVVLKIRGCSFCAASYTMFPTIFLKRIKGMQIRDVELSR